MSLINTLMALGVNELIRQPRTHTHTHTLRLGSADYRGMLAPWG